MNNSFDLKDWLSQVSEETLGREINIIDPHHHLWPGPSRTDGVRAENRYLLEDFWQDTESGHKVTKTVFVECGQGYFESGSEAMQPVVIRWINGEFTDGMLISGFQNIVDKKLILFP